MKKTCAGLMLLMLIVAAFTACGSKKGLTFSIAIIPPKSYVDQTVQIKAQNEEGLSDAYLIYPKGTMIPMKKTSNSLWELDFVLPAGKVGKINLEVVGKPSDGSPAITKSFEYEIMENPTISAKVVSENSDGVELEVKTSKPFKKVYIQTDDNKQINFESKGDNTYKVKTKELDLENKNYLIKLEDENGALLKSELVYIPFGASVPFIYRIDEMNSTPTKYPLVKINPLNKETSTLANLQLKVINDDQLEKIKEAVKTDESFRMHYISMSPSFDYVYINIIRDFVLQEKYVDSTGQILERVETVYAAVYNLKTDSYELIGEPNYYKTYKRPKNDLVIVIKEEGPLFYFMRWEGEKLILLEQRKDTKLLYVNLQKDEYQDNRSIKTTSKIVAYSISTKSFADTNENPVTDWLCFSDPYTGIQGWALPMQVMSANYFNIPYPYRILAKSSPIIITIKGSQKRYNYKDIIPIENEGKPLLSLTTDYTGFEDGKPFVSVSATYEVYHLEEIGGKKIHKTYKLYPLTGELIQFCSKTIEKKIIGTETITEITPKTDCFEGYSKYFTVKDGKIYANKKSNKYINPVDSINKIY